MLNFSGMLESLCSAVVHPAVSQGMLLIKLTGQYSSLHVFDRHVCES